MLDLFDAAKGWVAFVAPTETLVAQFQLRLGSVVTSTGSRDWGIAALGQCSQIDFETLRQSQRYNVNALPAMIYRGVRTTETVPMRMNMEARSTAEGLGVMFQMACRDSKSRAVSPTRSFFKDFGADAWQRTRVSESALSGARYKPVGEIPSGHGHDRSNSDWCSWGLDGNRCERLPADSRSQEPRTFLGVVRGRGP